ncbi:BrnA antitoxin family protein [Rhodovulum kholense]|uniref:BrnA antitoxin of type II toxin-antitoxin system n=1 Tax=Rhodovulum kholense TaxID=453584 RepID=A0A8E3APH3_9RHOB|nr:BrnA antitoxin family protein [Rhodovulum kholense]PTW45672.1 BrnA antitoxin of type II toxin-antitoxin system [Rhodovulum kholense]
MTESKKHTAPDLSDDAPDLSAPEWQEKFAAAKVQRGRPKAEKTKVSTTIRLSPEVIEYFKADGPGWQSRIDEALRKVAGL